jgi:hypothetical protein
MAVVSGLVWGLAYALVFVPAARLYRLIFGLEGLGHGGSRANSYWHSRSDRPFDDMRRQGGPRRAGMGKSGMGKSGTGTAGPVTGPAPRT